VQRRQEHERAELTAPIERVRVAGGPLGQPRQRDPVGGQQGRDR
jgi:hypothetical protein